MAGTGRILGLKDDHGLNKRKHNESNNSFNFHIKNEEVPYYGTIKGISSNEKGYSASSLDLYRNTFKFFVYFPKLKEHRFVIPNEKKHVLFDKYGVNEEAYVGSTVVVYSTTDILPKYINGDICIKDIENLKRKQLSYMKRNNVDIPNSVLVKDTNPMIESVGFFTGAFSGILSPESGWLLNCIAKRNRNV